MHELTSSGSYILEIKLKNGGQTKTAKWTSFYVDSESNKYRLFVSGFDQGTSGLPDLLNFHNGMYFSTRNRDNDIHVGQCSKNYYGSGWWFRNCIISHLNIGDSSGPLYYSRNDESTMILKRK